MKRKMQFKSLFFGLLALVVVLFCGFLPKIVSNYQDKAVEAQAHTRPVEDLSMTVRSVTPFARLVLSSGESSLLPLPETRAQHTEAEIYRAALAYLEQLKNAGLVGQLFTVSSHACNLRMHANDGYDNFWHVNLYCETGEDSLGPYLMALNMTISDENEKLYALHYSEVTEGNLERPELDLAEVASRLQKLYFSQLNLDEYATGWEQPQGEYAAGEEHHQLDYILTEKTDGPSQTPPTLRRVFLNFFVTPHDYYIDVSPMSQTPQGDAIN